MHSAYTAYSMSVRSSKASSLLALLQTAPTEPSGLSAAEPQPRLSPKSSQPGATKPGAKRVTKKPHPNPQRPPEEAPAAGRTGRRVTIFLHEEDRRIIRDLMAYLAGQGRRVSESIVIKAALRTAQPGQALLNAHEEAARQDQRFKEAGSGSF
jgi:hypothetical protein